MPRPPKPLISRRSVAEAAVSLIDDDGLEEFSLPKLAKRLNVTTPSIYHHFTDRDDVLAATCLAVFGEVQVPRFMPDRDWRDWFVAFNLELRRVVLRHRNVAPLLIRFLHRDALVGIYERSVQHLREAGVPASLHMLILEGTERVGLGAIVAEATRESSRRVNFPRLDESRNPELATALRANHRSSKRIFEDSVRSFLRGLPES